MEGLTFPQVAERMGRSVDSVEKLWMRALGQLRKQFTAT
jgi:RNA polymerase sigma-70 factor (ECF subfamily)